MERFRLNGNAQAASAARHECAAPVRGSVRSAEIAVSEKSRALPFERKRARQQALPGTNAPRPCEVRCV